MDTWIKVQVVSTRPGAHVESSIYKALEWMTAVERALSRFEPDSEVMRLPRRPGRALRVSALLFEATDFAVRLARLTDGVFDPTAGGLLERHGFNRSYRTGLDVKSGLDEKTVSYRDVKLDRHARTVTLRRPLVLDLGAIAKGLAVDLVSRDLTAQGLLHFSVEAGGDVYARGLNASGIPWQIGIQHPRAESLLIGSVSLSDAAICTSGDYERRAPNGTSHILDARTARPPAEPLASVSVMAPTAMAADGLSTAAMILGRERGLKLLEAQGVSALLIQPDGRTFTTQNGFGVSE